MHVINAIRLKTILVILFTQNKIYVNHHGTKRKIMKPRRSRYV